MKNDDLKTLIRARFIMKQPHTDHNRSHCHDNVVAPELSRTRHKMSHNVTCQHNAGPDVISVIIIHGQGQPGWSPVLVEKEE